MTAPFAVPEGAPFHLLTLGPFPRHRVRCSLGQEPIASNDETRRFIAEAWDARLKIAETRGQLLFPGPMCGLRAWRVDAGDLVLEFGATDYREFVGTNLAHPEIGDRYGDAYLANGSGVCATVATSDGKLLVQRRSRSVYEHPGMLHVCGGALNPVTVDGRPTADPFAVMTREIEEELGIGADRIAEMDCLGLARDGDSRKPDVLLRYRLTLPSSAIPTGEAEEHSDLLLVDGDPGAVAAWLTDHWHEVAPAGLACLVAHLACTIAGGLAATWVTGERP